MTDEPTTKAEPVRTTDTRSPGSRSSSSDSQPTAPSSSPTIGDPERRGFGDITDDASRRGDVSKTDEHRGSGNRPQRDRQSPSNPPTQGSQPTQPNLQSPKAPLAHDHGKSGSDCNISSKTSDAKPDVAPSSGSSSE